MTVVFCSQCFIRKCFSNIQQSQKACTVTSHLFTYHPVPAIHICLCSLYYLPVHLSFDAFHHRRYRNTFPNASACIPLSGFHIFSALFKIKSYLSYLLSCQIVLIHSFTDGHFACFQHLAVVNCAAMNTGVHRFF